MGAPAVGAIENEGEGSSERQEENRSIRAQRGPREVGGVGRRGARSDGDRCRLFVGDALRDQLAAALHGGACDHGKAARRSAVPRSQLHVGEHHDVQGRRHDQLPLRPHRDRYFHRSTAGAFHRERRNLPLLRQLLRPRSDRERQRRVADGRCRDRSYRRLRRVGGDAQHRLRRRRRGHRQLPAQALEPGRRLQRLVAAQPPQSGDRRVADRPAERPGPGEPDH